MIDLVADGILTREEFARKKSQLKDRQYELTELLKSYDGSVACVVKKIKSWYSETKTQFLIDNKNQLTLAEGKEIEQEDIDVLSKMTRQYMRKSLENFEARHKAVLEKYDIFHRQFKRELEFLEEISIDQNDEPDNSIIDQLLSLEKIDSDQNDEPIYSSFDESLINQLHSV